MSASLGTQGNPAAPTAAAMSQAEYLAKANAICAAGTRRSDALGNGPADPTHATASDLPALAKYLSAQRAVAVGELRQLRALPLPPSGARGVVTAYRKLAATIADLHQAITAAGAGDLQAYNAAVVAVSTETDAANQAAIAAGLTVCGS